MKPEDLVFFKNLILEKVQQTNENVEVIEKKSRNEGNDTSEDRSTYSLHMADHGTDAMEREKSLLLAQRGGDYLDYLHEALERIEAGTFGVCRLCGGTIGRARLEAVPTATQCIECKSMQEKA